MGDFGEETGAKEGGEGRREEIYRRHHHEQEGQGRIAGSQGSGFGKRGRRGVAEGEVGIRDA